MVLFLGMFLVNTLCALVPCQKLYDPPVPVPINPGPGGGRVERENHNGNGNVNPNLNVIKIPILGERKANDFVVRIEEGFLQGFPMRTIRAREIVAFTSIPYAEPPVKNLRFAAPVARRPWGGVLDAGKTANECIQIDGMQLLRIVGVEDCLYANVYTPRLPSKNNETKSEAPAGLPVMIFIHGGSFAFSSGSAFGPAYLLDKDVILVTFNYRLSSFGFLSTGDSDAPGNWGLKDQNLLLRWVQRNIHAFGGDPTKVTLFGQSAGGVSVHLHMLSKQSQGLFRQGISQSGNAFCFWGVRDNSIDFTFKLATALKCSVNSSALLLNCLRKLDPLLIAYTEANLPNYKVFPGVFFGPIVEPRSEEAFLEERPEILYAQNKVAKIPWINGFLADEGNGVGFLSWLYPMVLHEMDQRWIELGPSILDIQGDIKHKSQVASRVRQKYFGDKAINFYSRKSLTRMMGDRLIMGAVHKGLKYHSRVAPTYGYFFNYTGRYGHAAIYGLNNYEWGISHDDDLIYLLNSTTYQALKVGEAEYEMSEFMTNVWASFATHMEPTYEIDAESHKEVHFWEPISDFRTDNLPLVLLNGDMPKMISFPFLDRVRFWDDMGLISRSKVGPFTLMPKANMSPRSSSKSQNETETKNVKLKLLPTRLQFTNLRKPH